MSLNWGNSSFSLVSKRYFFSPQISLLCDEVIVEWNSNDFYDFSRTFSSRNFFLLLLQVESYKNNSCNNSNHSLECLTYIQIWIYYGWIFYCFNFKQSAVWNPPLQRRQKNLRKILFHYFNSLLNSFPPYIVILFWKALERKKKTIKNSITK